MRASSGRFRRRFERGEHGVCKPGPCGGLDAQLRPSLHRERIEPRPPVVFRCPTLRRDPTTGFETVERGIERAFLDLEYIARGLLYPPRDGVAMCGPPTNGLEDEQVEGTAQNFDVGVGHWASVT